MSGDEPLVTCEFRELEGTGRYYVVYTFAPHWRVEHLRTALQEGLQRIAQRPVDETFESIFAFNQSESFDAVNLISEVRRTISHPDNNRFAYTSIVGLQGFAHNLVDNLLDIVWRFFGDSALHIALYATLDEALDAMRERANAAK
jgi:hypothetical protein